MAGPIKSVTDCIAKNKIRVGVGFVGKPFEVRLGRTNRWPNLEDLHKRIGSLGDVVPPVYFRLPWPLVAITAQYAGRTTNLAENTSNPICRKTSTCGISTPPREISSSPNRWWVASPSLLPASHPRGR